MRKVLAFLLAIGLGISGCGGTSGSTTDLKTVYITATATSDRLEADILTGNSCTAGGGTYTTQTIPVSVTATAYTNATTKSPVTIKNVQISFLKYDKNSAAPALPTLFDTGFTINPGETKTFDVKVAPDKLKLDLVQNYGFTLCSTDYWEYYATITFNGVEDFTGTSFSTSTSVKVAFADRNNL